MPTPEDAELARQAARQLARRVGRPLTLREVERDRPVSLPAPAVSLLVELLNELAAGRPVRIAPADAELTTQQAADLLGVSRPYLVGRLDAGDLPHRKVGAHRRIRRTDLLAYQQRTAAEGR